MRKFTAGFVLLLTLFTITASGLESITFAQTQGVDTAITSVDASQFPDMSLQVRVSGPDYLPVTGMGNVDFQVREDASTVLNPEVQAVDEGIWVHFVADAGVFITGQVPALGRKRWESIITPITDYLQTTPWMRSNLDHTAVTVVEANGPRAISGFSTNGPGIARALGAYQFPQGELGLSYTGPVLSSILDEMHGLEEARGQQMAIVLFSYSLETRPLAPVLQKAQRYGIPVYTVSTGGFDQILDNIAAETSGQYAQYTGKDTLNDMFARLTSLRSQYLLRYRSRANQTGEHTVEVTVQKAGGGVLAVQSTTYQVEVSRPLVEIIMPETGSLIARAAQEYVIDPDSVEPTSAAVSFSISFPDNHARGLEQARLLVNGEQYGAALQLPDIRGTLPWDLRRIRQQGTQTFSLVVEVVDELGLVSSSNPVLVDVALSIPPPPTPPINVTEVISIVTHSIPTPTPIPPCPLTEPRCIAETARTEWLSLVSILVGLSAIAFVALNRNRLAPIMREAGHTMVQAVDRITRRNVVAVPKAYLVVLDGVEEVGRSLEVYGTTRLGRSRQKADLVFQQYDENSAVSRLHSTIIDNEDHFLIRDEDSENGTFLNGTKLEVLVEEELHDGDEIELGQVQRGGVKLLFQIAEQGVSRISTVTNRSRIALDSQAEVSQEEEF